MLEAAAASMLEGLKGREPRIIAAIEARGFVIGPVMAKLAGARLLLVRKKGKLPRATVSETYELEYGTDTVEIHRDDVPPGAEAVVVDDLLATGGTAAAAARLLLSAGAKVTGACFLVELDFLSGREKLIAAGVPAEGIVSLVHYGEGE